MLVLVAVMSRGMVACGMMATYARLVDWMDRGSAISRGDSLRASHMHRRLAGNPGAESKAVAAVMASLLSDRAQRMALVMVAGAAAWAALRSGRRYNDGAHVIALALIWRRLGSS
jgi:hypothetical protein